MKAPEIFIITEEGERTSGPVFGPLFQTILPALQEGADQVRIAAKGMGVSAEFVHNGQSSPLKVHKDYHPAVTSSRIRIASGMSIVPQDLQTGNMQVGYDGRSANVAIEIKRTATHETILMKFTWKTAE